MGGRGASAGTGGGNKGGNNAVDKALGKQGKPYSVEEAMLGANEKFKTGLPEFRKNCQRCVWAVEARRRGFDVEAMPRTPDDEYAMPDESLPKSYLNVGTTPVNLDWHWGWRGSVTATELKDSMLQHGVGARGMLVMQNSRWGHVCNWEVTAPGKVVIYDGQVGRKTSITELKKRFFTFAVGRMDDKQFSPLIQDFVKPRK